MVHSLTDDDKGTLPPKPIRRVVTLGSIPNTDAQFLEWCGYQTRKQSPLDMMKLYVNKLNEESHQLYERQKKERKEQIIKATNADDLPAAELLESSLNNPNSQIIPSPNSQIIPSPNSQNITLPRAQEQSTPPYPRTSFPEQSRLIPSILSANSCPED